ncbi:MAG: DASS family sodium-coupled anion symporter [Thermodesulforhabdaceae bacterium]
MMGNESVRVNQVKDEEIREVLSEKEERLENFRKSIGLFLGPLVAIIVYLIPMPSLSPKAHILASIVSWVAVWWVTEPIPIPVSAIWGAILCVILGVADIKKVLAPFADPIIYLFFGSFIIAEAMRIHGLDKRFTYAIMSIKSVGNSTAKILVAFGVICAFLSMWISNTATTAMMYPIGLGVVYSVADLIHRKTGNFVDPKKLRFGTGMMLMAAYSASAGGIGTPVGTPPNIIGIAMIEKFCNVKIAFFQWMAFAVPLLILMSALLFVLMYYLHKPEVSRLEGATDYILKEKALLGSWTRGQKNVMIVFSITVALWLIPGIIALIYGTDGTIYKNYNKIFPESIAALIGAALLFLLPTNWKEREFTISWKQATNIDWGTLLLFGGGITLGNLMFELKLADAIGKSLMNLTGATSMWGITLGAIFIAILVSETSSNTASANMVVPVIISLAQAAGVNPVPPAIGATLGASWGFMLPVSTPPNAIVYGSGMVPITKMIRAGIYFDILGGLLIWAGLMVLLPMLGLA